MRPPTGEAGEGGLLNGETIAYLADYGEEWTLDRGELLFDETAPVNSFYVVLDGEIRVSRLDGLRETEIACHGAGDWTGGLTILTGKGSIHRGRAAVPTRVLEIPADRFRTLAAENPRVGDVFIAGLARRMRETSRALRQQDKLVALGKLSAGLAHELNNPAAAARRAADELHSSAKAAQLEALGHDERFSQRDRETLYELAKDLMYADPPILDALEASEREDEVVLWLEDRGEVDPYDLAATLVSAGVDEERLDWLEGELEGSGMLGAVRWLGSSLALARLADEVGQSAERISQLVGAIKEHTHMDRAAQGPVDVRRGIESALTILGHKLKRVSLEKRYESQLPVVTAYGGELNQVWLNLLDNAADAAESRVAVEVCQEDGRVAVTVRDDGPGIAREDRKRIFEPFFTTKGVGEGTGLGLDVVRRIVARHGGEVSVVSEPGDTRFTVRLSTKGEEKTI